MKFKIALPKTQQTNSTTKSKSKTTTFSVIPKKIDINKEPKQPIQHFFITNSENVLSIKFDSNVFGVRKSPYEIFQQNTEAKYNEQITKVLKFIKLKRKENMSFDDIYEILRKGEFATGFQSFLKRITETAETEKV